MNFLPLFSSFFLVYLNIQYRSRYQTKALLKAKLNLAGNLGVEKLLWHRPFGLAVSIVFLRHHIDTTYVP